MTQPLALVYYRNYVTGRQLVSRLQDLDYRVQALDSVGEVVGLAETHKPLLIVMELTEQAGQVFAALTQIRQGPTTCHIPVLAYSSLPEEKLLAHAREAGATVVASGVAVLAHLPQLLDQTLQVE